MFLIGCCGKKINLNFIQFLQKLRKEQFHRISLVYRLLEKFTFFCVFRFSTFHKYLSGLFGLMDLHSIPIHLNLQSCKKFFYVVNNQLKTVQNSTTIDWISFEKSFNWSTRYNTLTFNLCHCTKFKVQSIFFNFN
jgi:hypothetical protein